MWYISKFIRNWFLFLIINKRREKMYWEESGKISKLKNNFLYESQFLQPIMILIIFFATWKSLYCRGSSPRTTKHRSLQSGSRNSILFSKYILLHMVWLTSQHEVVKPFLAINTLKMIYHSYFHWVMTFGLLFWGNSPDSIQIFGCKKRSLELWQVVDIEIHVENCLLN